MSSNIFGGISSDMDSLPEGYGDSVSSAVGAAGTTDPDLAGIKDWDIWKRQSEKTAAASGSDEEEDDKDRFWSNWKIAGGEGTWGKSSEAKTGKKSSSTGTSCKTGVGYGGYRYKIKSNGDIKVIAGDDNVGKTYKAGSTAANRVQEEFPSEYALCTSSGTAAGKVKKKKSDKKRGKRLETALGVTAGLLPQLMAMFGPEVDVKEPDTGGTGYTEPGPNWMLWGGVGLGVIVVGGILFVTLGKDDK